MLKVFIVYLYSTNITMMDNNFPDVGAGHAQTQNDINLHDLLPLSLKHDF